MWIHYVQTKYIYDDTERQWEENDKNSDGKITWEEYKEHTYGFLTEEELNHKEDDGFSYEQMLFRDERRWKQADQDKKGYLTKEELTAFLHPEEYDHMKDMVIVETIEDIDRDKDGKISLEEYIGDMWHEEGEAKHLIESCDSNNDGKLSHQEILNHHDVFVGSQATDWGDAIVRHDEF